LGGRILKEREMNLDTHFLAALLGGILQELVHWYERRGDLSTKEASRLLRSKGYWIVTSLMILGSAFGTIAWLEKEVAYNRTYLLMGAAFPLLLKKAVSAFASNTSTKLGEPSSNWLQQLAQYVR
jgi:uncharacterized membrane-anchored protein